MKYAPCKFCGKSETTEEPRAVKDQCEICRKLCESFSSFFKAHAVIPDKPEKIRR